MPTTKTRHVQEPPLAAQVDSLILSSSRAPWPAATARAARASLSGDAARLGEVEQPLPLGVLLRPLEEEPGEHPEGDEAPLDHHDHAGDALVGDGEMSQLASPAA